MKAYKMLKGLAHGCCLSQKRRSTLYVATKPGETECFFLEFYVKNI